MGLRGALATLSTVLLVSLIGAGGAAAQSPGELDPSFGSGGVVGTGAQLLGVAVQSDGSVVAAGQASGRAVAYRFSAAGALEDSWAGPGGYARGIAVEPSGDVVVSGQGNGALFVARLTATLQPDGSFGSGGVASALPGGSANGVAVEPDGSIVAAGGVGTGFELARFSPTGGVEWAANTGGGDNSFARGVAVQPNGKIVVVGQQRPGPTHQVTNGVIERLNPDGSLDSSFAGGAEIYYYPNTGYTSLTAVAVQNNGQIVAAGVSAGGPTAIFVRYNSNGSLDGSFGSGGAAGLPAGQNIATPGAALGPYGIAIAGGGRIISAGAFGNTGTGVDAGEWAVTTTGATASDFAGSGTALGPDGAIEACAVAVAPDGGIVAVGDAVSAFPDTAPCTAGSTSAGFVSRRIGYGPPPPPASSSAAPSVSTGSATGVKATTATLTGAVNPNGLPTTYYFAYGKTTAYGSNTAAGTLAAGGTSDSVSAALSKLAPSTTYHFALVAANADGTTVGPDVTFKTSASPPKLTVALHGVPSSYKISSLTAHGLAIKVTCGSACSVRASLLVSSKLAKRLGLGHRQTAIASGSASLRRAGTVKLTLHLSSTAKHAIRRSASLAVTLRVVATPTGGGRAQTINKGLTLKH
jgi:uncharacterized delta-60 repeat protein